MSAVPYQMQGEKDKNGLRGEQRVYLEEEIERRLSVHAVETWEGLRVHNFLRPDGTITILNFESEKPGIDAWWVADMLLGEKASARLTFRAVEIATSRQTPLPAFLVDRLRRQMKIVPRRTGGAKSYNTERWSRCVALVAENPDASDSGIADQVGVDEKTVKSWRAQWKFRAQVGCARLFAFMEATGG